MALVRAGIAEDGPTTGSAWPVPESVDVDGRILRWRLGNGPERTPGPGMLEAFARLGSLPMSRFSDGVAAFAREWGVLFVSECELDRQALRAEARGQIVEKPYGLRHAHSPEARDECRLRSRYPVEQGWEDLATWRRYARQANVLLRIAAGHRDEPVRLGPRQATCLAPLGADERYFDHARDAHGRIDRRGLLGSVVDRWLTVGDVRTRFEFDNGPAIEFGGDGPFGALAFQVVRAVTRTDGIAICVECGTPYVPTRRPARGRENFCRECADKARWRRAKQRSRKPRQEGDPS